MSIYSLIADVINKLLTFGVLTPSHSETTQVTPPTTNSPGVSGSRCLITIPEIINAHFMSTGSAAWANQHILAEDGQTYDGIHGGTDFGATVGSPVFAPKDMTVIAVGHYSDAGRMGDYVIGNWSSGEQYYSGHLDNVRVHIGDEVKCGDQIGQTNVYNHTHIQLKRGNVYLDPEKYL